MFSGRPLSDIIEICHLWTRWRIPTCSNMPYATYIPTIVCLLWPLEAFRGQHAPESLFSGCPQSDIIVVHHFQVLWTLPTCSDMPYTTLIPTIVCLVWPLEASRGPNEPQMSVFGTFPEWYYRDILLMGPCEPSHNIRGGVLPTLDQV